jgi:(S)-3,5-dihydroxyphenylglycine transaminase
MQCDSQSKVMKFLNEVAEEFPAAISLAAGRPTDRYAERLGPLQLQEAQIRYGEYLTLQKDLDGAQARLLQYGRTAGMINDLVARQVKTDERVNACSSRTLITSGCQEALALCLPALCPDQEDVVLVCNPTYAGATGAAQANRIAVYPIPNTAANIVENIEQAAIQVRRRGQRPRALYLIPDFDNPTGRVLEESERANILEVCSQNRVVVLEDNPYGMFRYEGKPVLPLAAMDPSGCVIHLSTFSKTIAPALRVGAIILPEVLFGQTKEHQKLQQELIQRKSLLSVNTSQINQAIVGGILLKQGGSLQQWISPLLAGYRDNRDCMLGELQTAFADVLDQISWNAPEGGFFLALNLPFAFTIQDAMECATHYGVIVMPMNLFALDSSQEQRVRLSFSSVDRTQIPVAIRSLAQYAAMRMERCALAS